MDELFVVSSIIDKMPQTWKNITSTLKHKREEIGLTQLANHFLIEVGSVSKRKERIHPQFLPLTW